MLGGAGHIRCSYGYNYSAVTIYGYFMIHTLGNNPEGLIRGF